MDTKAIPSICAKALTGKVRITKAKTVTSSISIKPKSKIPWVSVEIECFFCGKSNREWYKIVSNCVAKAGVEGFVRIKDDGSIDPYMGHWVGPYNATSMEVVISAPETKFFPVLEKVCCILNSLGAKTNESCGLHIHLDHRLETNRNPVLSYNNLYFVQDLMFKLSNPSRRNCGFCDRVYSRSLFKSIEDRYYSINASALEQHQTIEVRVFHSTTSFEEISHFVSFLLGVIGLTKPLQKKVTSVGVSSLKTVPSDTRKFIMSKLSKRKKAA